MSIKNFPPLIVGGAVFNTQYSEDPFSLPTTQILQHAFDAGYNAVDTSPYYGPSEEIIGQALKSVTHTRDSYYICTKAGRVRLDEFDYSREHVRKSVLRSCKRLGTEYLDLVYMHDIEFVSRDDIFEALRELRLLKNEGVVRHIGVSGYPVEFLVEVARASAVDAQIGPLDAVMSYSHGCLQNTRLFDVYKEFYACGVQRVMNGSILSMSLLRSGSTMDFHPGAPSLKEAVARVAHKLLGEGIEMADVATRFAIKRWLLDLEGCKSVVLGVTTLQQLKDAIKAYDEVRGGKDEEGLYARIQGEFGEHMNEEWESGIVH